MEDEKKMDYKEMYENAQTEITQLKSQIDHIVKRYQKLSMLYNDVIDKFLSAE